MKMKIFLSIILSIALCTAQFNSIAFADWVQSDGKIYYELEDGNKVGWLSFTNGTRYYFDEDGVLTKGWVLTKDGRFYLDPSEKGNLSRDVEKKIGGITYKFDENGKVSDPYTDILIHDGFSGISGVSIEKLLSIGNVSVDDLAEFSLPKEDFSNQDIANKCGISVICYAKDGVVGLTKIGGVPVYIAVYFDKKTIIMNADFSKENGTIILKQGKKNGTEKYYATENKKLHYWRDENNVIVSAFLYDTDKIVYQIKY